MKARKDLIPGDTVMFRPKRWEFESQPFTIREVQDGGNGNRVLIENNNRKVWARLRSPNLRVIDPQQDLKPQYDKFLADQKALDKSYLTLELDEYYRCWRPRLPGRVPQTLRVRTISLFRPGRRPRRGGYVYYKISGKKAPSENETCHRLDYKWKGVHSNMETSENYYLVEDIDRKIFGRNFKHVSKLEGMIVLGE